jgi:hypothetical protein
MPEIGLVGPTYTTRSLAWDAEETINLYPEVHETKRGKSVSMLTGTPGLKLFTTLPKPYGIRGNGMYMSSVGRLFVVNGGTLYEVMTRGGYQERGALRTSAGPVCMTDNGLHMVIVDGPNGYVFDFLGTSLTQITSPNFYGADRVEFLDNYLLFNRPGTGQFYWTSISGVDFDALDFAAAEGSPDKLLSLLVVHQEIWLFGTKTIEIWFDVGNRDFPFVRMQGGYIETGIAAPHSVTKFPLTHYWLSGDERGAGIAYESQQPIPRRISTYATEYAWSQYPTIADAIGWGENRTGHQFWWLTFPSGNATWCYDTSTGFWHKRAYLNPHTGTFDRHRANAHAFAFGKHLVGDWENGTIYELDEQTYSDNGAPLKALRRAPYIVAAKANLPYVFHNTFQVDMETGVGLDRIGQGTAPQMMLRWSDTYGTTWTQERWTSVGRIGDQRVRAMWRRLGRSRARIYEVSMTDPVKRSILAAYLDSGVGTA